MARRSFTFIFLLILLFVAEISYSQNLRYSIVWKGDSVGHLLANKYDSAEFDIYKINSEVRFWFFGTKTILYNYKSVYKRDTLIKASTRYLRNGNLKAESTVSLNGRGYEVVVDGDYQLLTEPNPIDYSVTTIYHNEPNLVTSIFSERWGTVLSVRSPDPNHYFIEKPDGRSTEYFFENGICSKVVVDNFFATFTFERTE